MRGAQWQVQRVPLGIAPRREIAAIARSTEQNIVATRLKPKVLDEGARLFDILEAHHAHKLRERQRRLRAPLVQIQPLEEVDVDVSKPDSRRRLGGRRGRRGWGGGGRR